METARTCLLISQVSMHLSKQFCWDVAPFLVCVELHCSCNCTTHLSNQSPSLNILFLNSPIIMSLYILFIHSYVFDCMHPSFIQLGFLALQLLILTSFFNASCSCIGTLTLVGRTTLALKARWKGDKLPESSTIVLYAQRIVRSCLTKFFLASPSDFQSITKLVLSVVSTGLWTYG